MDDIKKPNNSLKFSLLLIGAALVIGFGYWYVKSQITNFNVEANADSTGHTIQVDKMVEKQPWDTISGKADVLDKISDLENQKKVNENLFKENIDDNNKIIKDYPVPDNGTTAKSSAAAIPHQKSLEERLKNEVARDETPQRLPQKQNVSGGFKGTKNSEGVQADQKTDNLDFQFGGFVVDRKNSKNQSTTQPTNANGNSDYSSPNDNAIRITESAQAGGVITVKSKIYYNASLPIRLKEDLVLVGAGVTIPKGFVITALAHLSGSRVSARVDGINLNGKIIKVGLTVFDTDGNEGLLVGTLKKDVNGSFSSSVNNTIGVASSSLGLGGQLAGGILSSFNKNTNKAEAIIPEGYKVILKE
jgi:hypothetical protein